LTKSPFLVIEEFISPLRCEDVVDECEFFVPDVDIHGAPVPSHRTCEVAQTILYHRLMATIPTIEQYFGVVYRGLEAMDFEWFPTGSTGKPRCENGSFVNGKWRKVNTRDLTGVLFLSDYQSTIPFEDEFEVYGGKLEFPQHQFSFNPQRGTLVLFPSHPHFINAVPRIFVGEAFQVRIQMVTDVPFEYDPRQFPGGFASWFAPRT